MGGCYGSAFCYHHAGTLHFKQESHIFILLLVPQMMQHVLVDRLCVAECCPSLPAWTLYTEHHTSKSHQAKKGPKRCHLTLLHPRQTLLIKNHSFLS